MTVVVSQPTSEPDHIVIPELLSLCPWPAAFHPSGLAITQQSSKWFDEGCPELTEKGRDLVYGLQAGSLAAYCYPNCDDEHLRIVADFLTYLFHIDDISDGMITRKTKDLADIVMNALWFPDEYRPTKTADYQQPAEEPSAGKLCRDFWRRVLKDAKPGPVERFKETFAQFFEAVYQQAQDRDADVVPDFEAYIDCRRDTSGCKSTFDFIEFSMGLNLPDHVANDPIVKSLNQAANDAVAWSNDIFSYNEEQARGDLTHNMVEILQKYDGLSLQGAIDHIGELFKQTIENFVEQKSRLPSWGPEIDREVEIYVEGLQHWITGVLNWSFMTERYFGKSVAEVKKTRIVKLLPKRKAPVIANLTV